MSLESPPPPIHRIAPPGPVSGELRARGVRLVKHSDTGVPGMDNLLAALIDLWTDGYIPPSHTIPIVSGPMLRWMSVKMMRLMLAEASGLTKPRTLPAAYESFWHNPRLSGIGAAIGSSSMAKKVRHLDVDWFGPSGNGPTDNWWRPDGNPGINGSQEELNSCQALMNYLEASLVLGPSSADPATWTWPPGISSGTSIDKATETMFDSKTDAAFLNHLVRNDPLEVRLEWHVGDRNSSTRPTAFSFTTNVRTLVITTPDANGPDRY